MKKIVVLSITLIIVLFCGCDMTPTIAEYKLFRMIRNGEDVTNFDTSTITDMSNMFFSQEAFNQDISGWSAHVEETIFHGYFSGATCPLPTEYHPYESWDN